MSKEQSLTIPHRLLICGASARAAAFSALRAGIEPLCADLFADEDLRRVAPVTRIQNYPKGVAATIAELADAPWMYTGALENFPDTIAEIARRRILLGNGPATLARVRDPATLMRRLQACGLPALEVRSAADPPPRDGTWVRKPLQSAGGVNIRIWDAAAENRHAQRPAYFQRRAAGDAYSALFLALPSGAELIGITRQLVGVPDFHAASFAYCGSVGPIRLPDRVERQLRDMGECIAKFAGMRGLFGCDFLFDGTTARLTEVNPRYTASVEIYERCWHIPLLGWHCRACQDECDAAARDEFRRQIADLRGQRSEIHGKAILFARETCQVGPIGSSVSGCGDPWRADIADIPAPGSTITAGHPICTVFATANTIEGCFDRLVEKSTEIVAASWTSGPYL